MESKQANSSLTSDQLPGSSIKTTLTNSYSNINEETNVLNNNNSSRSTNDGGYSSEDEGFVSGEEDFESEKPVLPDPDDETAKKGVTGEESGDPGSSEFSMPIANVLADDDDAEKGEEKVVGGEGFEGKAETVVGTISGENLSSNSNELVKDNVFCGIRNGGFEEDKVVEYSQLNGGLVYAIKDSSRPEGEVEKVNLKGEEDLDNRNIEALDGEGKVVNEVVKEHAVESDNTE